MSNPTSNFGWVMPTATDLVTDLPADFEVFGQSVDSSLAQLKGGTTGQVLSKTSATDMAFTWVAQDDSNAIQNAIVDAKGDLIGATAADTPARLAVGTNGQVLTADSTAGTGLAWATPSSGGMTLINTGGTTLTGTSVTISSIPGTYNSLQVIIVGWRPSPTGNYLVAQFNGDSGTRYFSATSNTTGAVAFNRTNMDLSLGQHTSGTNSLVVWDIPYYANTAIWKGSTDVSFENDATTSTNLGMYRWMQLYNQTTAITSITFSVANGISFAGGTAYVYGVK